MLCKTQISTLLGLLAVQWSFFASRAGAQQCALVDLTPGADRLCPIDSPQTQQYEDELELPYVSTPYSNDNPSCTPQLDYINDKLCVYTHPSFNNNHGISLFTTSTLATEFSNRLTQLSTHPNTTTYIHPDLSLRPLPSRGLGYIATQPIPPGTLLTSTCPILLVHNLPTPHTFERESHLLHAIAHLPPSTQHAFNTLARTHPEMPHVHAQDIIKTNTFALDIGGTPHLAIFPEASRFNHDCAPNAMYVVDSLRLTHVVHSTREIGAGEEVTISYIDPFSDSEWRQGELREAFGFGCVCARCKAAEADDEVLAEIRVMQEVLGDWEMIQEGMEWWDYTAKAQRLVALYKGLGLEGFMNTAYGHATLTFNSVGDEKEATMFAMAALEAARWRHGSETGSRAVKVWEEFLEGGATRHWSWKRRMAEEDL